ncbi:unnamed protein product [Gongylonema pulchrum]|uniref:Uncharacterized protein n=1 Tax=Gongylonema pulchrum TaxID=637853 RepID=A0A3P6QMW5_9BILA|nr:unnamed protein product [Gongylonema pulchrum]
MAQLHAENVASSTTFSNPVYEMEESPDVQSVATTPSSLATPVLEPLHAASAISRSQSLDIKPELSTAIIAPHADLRPGAPIPPKRTLKEGSDKVKLVSGDQVTDV